ncbi:MAG TPA: AmmeMemoRadiSam system protein B, partial [Gemmatimonadaceae bacterium]|nr:AmmeMemoRadiSam system protein B [Gemmatimonadaceae bacterium]
MAASPLSQSTRMVSRPPAVSGTFYPSLAGRLSADVRAYLESSPAAPRRAVGLMVPHAGHMYSGATAGAGFASVTIPGSCVILAPHHLAAGTARYAGSTLLEASYRTPLGDVLPDGELGMAIRRCAGDLLDEDELAHRGEHSIEVLLPFLQVCAPDTR